MFCTEPTLFCFTQYPDRFITFKDGFKMHTGKRNQLELPENEQYTKLSTQLISGKLAHT